MFPIAHLFRDRMQASIEPYRHRRPEKDPLTAARDDAVAAGSMWLFSGLALPGRSRKRQ